MVYILGHRGAMGSAPENTAASFKMAMDYGADGVEFDIQLTKDKKIVVVHDFSVNRTTDGNGFIRDLSLKELKKLDAGTKFNSVFTGEKILTLGETLEIVKDSKIINIELKNGPIFYPGLEERVLEIINITGLKEKIIISSFNHYSLNKIKELDPDIKVGILYMAALYQPWEYAKRLGAVAIHPYYQSISPEIISKCHIKGIMVNVFGVNDRKSLKKMIKIGVDSIITDYPEIGIELRNEL